jgi:hypothetical protein
MNTTLEQDIEVYKQMRPGTVWIWDKPADSDVCHSSSAAWLILENKGEFNSTKGHYKSALRMDLGSHYVAEDYINLPFVILYREATEEEQKRILPYFLLNSKVELNKCQKIVEEKQTIFDLVAQFVREKELIA